MGLEEPEIISLNKSRQMAVYLRPDGHGGWIKTSPLPADPASINYYFLKGFRAPPREDSVPERQSSNVAVVKKAEVVEGKLVITCPMPGCDFTSTSAFGLQAHLRKHIEGRKKKEET